MHHNLQYNQKLSQVIQLALNYKNHRKSLSQIKTALKIPSLQKIQQNQTLKHNQIKYAHQSRKNQQNHISNDNRLQTSRMMKVKSSLKSIYSPQSHQKTIKSPEHKINPISSASQSRVSQRPGSHRSISSNYGSRSRRQKQIENQNKKIANRVQHPKMSKHLNNQYFDKQFVRQQEYLRIRSRFSDRSKSIMQSLTLDGLKMSKKDLGFLPQIGSHHENIKNKEIRTLESSRSYGQNRKGKQEQSMNRQKIKFLNNIPNEFKSKSRYLM